MTEDGGHQVSVFELARLFERFERESHASFQSIHRRLDELNYVHPETFAMQMQLEQALRRNIEERVEKIEGSQQWLARTLAAAIIAAVIGVLVATSGWSPQ